MHHIQISELEQLLQIALQESPRIQVYHGKKSILLNLLLIF